MRPFEIGASAQAAPSGGKGKPSSIHPVTPPAMIFTAKPRRESFAAARAAPLQ